MLLLTKKEAFFYNFFFTLSKNSFGKSVRTNNLLSFVFLWNINKD